MACLTPQMGLHFESMWIFILSFMAAAHAAKVEKDVCQLKELARRDCRLTVHSYNLRLLPDTVAWNDGTWRTVDDMPLKGDGVTWERASFEFLNGWPILQLWIWDAGAGENKVQSLHWYVADAEKRRFTILAEGVVRRRRVGEGGKIIYDPEEAHSLTAQKNGSLLWKLRNEQKRIERVKHGI